MRLVRTARRAAFAVVTRTLPLYQRRWVLYAARQRRRPRLREPVTFTEKGNWRVLYDRRDALKATGGKLEMKRYAATVAGALPMPRTVWSGTDVRELAGVELPERWVLKPNHRSNLVHFGAGPVADVGALERRVRDEGWMDDHQLDRMGEWAYAFAQRTLLVEEAIGTDGMAPDDYKLFVFDGVPRMIQVDSSRFSGHRRRHYRPDWTPLPHRSAFPLGPVTEPPARLGEMLEAAATLAAGFDFMRVDLYDVEDGLYFGELTPYPGGGLSRFVPRDLDFELGSYWRLPDPAR